jgi:hypothetical protein
LEVNYYELFGISHRSSFREIKIAYRRMAEVYHPDKLSHLPPSIRQEGEEIMRLINEAKVILLNPDRREEYDINMGFKEPDFNHAIVLQEISPSRTQRIKVKKNVRSKMKRVLSTMKDTFSRDEEFQEIIARAEEIVEARVLDDEEDLVFELDDEDDIEMTPSFTIVETDDRKVEKYKQKNGKGFRIVAVEVEDDEEALRAVDIEWEEE